MLSKFTQLIAAVSLSALATSAIAQSKLEPPKLDRVFDLHLQLGKPTDIGTVGPAGMRRIVPVTGGTLDGPGMSGGAPLKGTLQPGADYQVIRTDGVTELDAHYVVKLDSGDLIYINNRGMRHGPADVIAQLAAGKQIDQSKIYFRSIISIETAGKSLDWMNKSIFVCIGERQPNEAVIHVYRLN